MGRRRLAREIVLQALYLADCSRMKPSEAFRLVTVDYDRKEDKVLDFARDLLEGTAARLEALDGHLRAHATNWEIGRMALVDRNILRMAAFELLHRLETPVSVVIDEALEIAKKYSAEDSSRFINGVLDKLKMYRRDGSPDPGGGP